MNVATVTPSARAKRARVWRLFTLYVRAHTHTGSARHAVRAPVAAPWGVVGWYVGENNSTSVPYSLSRFSHYQWSR